MGPQMIELLILRSVPDARTVGLWGGLVFFLVLVLAAYVAFKALKKTVKFALRIAIVITILVIAVAGSLSLWYFSEGGVPRAKPPARSR